MDSARRPQRTRGTGVLAARFLDGRTRLQTFFQEGAAKIRLPESFDGRMEAVLINTSGGLTGGDIIDWQIEAGAGTDLTITTQACERIYRSSGGTATIRARLSAGPAARLFWLPQETILFNEGRLERRLDVALAGDSEFVAVESVLLGRRAMGETVVSGAIGDQWRIRRDGRLIHAEALRLDGDVDALRRRRACLGGHGAIATLLYAGPRVEQLALRLRAAIAASERLALSVWPDKLVVRMAAEEAYDLRQALVPAISHLRTDGLMPKVWAL